jgi:PIN domain nuclease of toxin-antitoxin system
VRLLLDTHAFLWWFEGSSRMSMPARQAVDDDSNEVLVSAASAWEMAAKHRLVKLPSADPIASDMASAIAVQDFEDLPITVEEAARAGALPGPHRDPFDRMLIAQALSRNLILISNDAAFDRYPIHRLW